MTDETFMFLIVMCFGFPAGMLLGHGAFMLIVISWEKYRDWKAARYWKRIDDEAAKRWQR